MDAFFRPKNLHHVKIIVIFAPSKTQNREKNNNEIREEFMVILD